MDSTGILLVLLVLSVCGAKRVCALQCYCHFDPGDSAHTKACSGQPTTCNVTAPQAVCFYFRGLVRLPNNAGTTVTVEYGCLTGTDGFNCNTIETDFALTQCCYTDLCNQNFSKLLKSERPVSTPTATTTPVSNTSSTTVSPYIWAAVGVSASVLVLFVLFVVSFILMGVYVCYVQKRHGTPGYLVHEPPPLLNGRQSQEANVHENTHL